MSALAKQSNTTGAVYPKCCHLGVKLKKYTYLHIMEEVFCTKRLKKIKSLRQKLSAYSMA